MLRRASWVVAGLAVSAFLALAAPVAHAALTVALSMRELTASSDVIVVGTVVDTECKWDLRRRIVTDAEVQVAEVLRGRVEVGDELVVRTLGGEIDDLGMRVEGEAVLEDGQRAIFFLRRRAGVDYLRPVGMSQGVMPLQRRNGHDIVIPGGGGSALVDRVSTGELVDAPAAIVHETEMSTVLDEIRRLVREQTAP